MATLYSVEVSAGDHAQPFVSGARHKSLINLRTFLKRLLSGGHLDSTTLTVRNSAAKASGTITLASCAAATVVEVNGVPFTAVSTTPVVANNEFDVSGTDAADATSLKNAINNSTTAGIADVVTATSTGSSGVVTVTSDRSGSLGNALTIKTLGVVAKGHITAAAVEALDTITINGTALTGKQQRATGTVTCATAVAGDTVTINGVTLTGTAGAVTLGERTFSVDTGDNETATSLAAQINALTDPAVSGKITATSSTDTVTLRAVDAGTGGNAYTLASSDGDTLAVSDETLTGGIAVANNEFEIVGTNTQVAADMARAINASTTAAISAHVRATSNAAVLNIYAKYSGTPGNHITTASSDGTRLAVTGSAARLLGGTEASSNGVQASAIVTCASVQNGDTVTVGGVVFTAHTDTEAANQFSIAGGDNATAASLAKMFNDSATALARDVLATASSAAVTFTSRRGGVCGNSITIATSNGSRLAITGSVSRLASGAVPTTVVPNGARLASGAETLITYSY